ADGSLGAMATPFPWKSEVPPAVVTVGDELWVAEWQALTDATDTSRVRVAHFDASLARLGPDAAFDGWGGLAPQALALSVRGGAVRLLTYGLDARFGPTPVVHALRVPASPCVGAVPDPLVGLDAGPAATPWLSVASFASTPDRVWLVRS